MRKSMFMLLLVAQQAMAQVNVYECDPAYAPTTAQEVNNAAYHLHKPCILMENEPYEIITNYPKYVTASEYIHIKAEDQNQDYFHAGPYSGTDHFWMRIENKDIPYEIWALNYNDLTAIPRYKKLELGIKLEGELLDRINAFLHQTSTHPEPLNPFLEWELDIKVKFVHAQTLTEKWMDGFYYQDYERNTNINDWIPLPTDFPMRVRFAPPLNGLWNTYVSITYDNITIELPMFSFNVVESGDPGYVTVHNNKKNLQRDGNVIFPVGHNFPGPSNGVEIYEYQGMTPSQTNKAARVDDWASFHQDIVDYVVQGGKFIKLTQAAYSSLIEFENLGNYYNRLHYAWEQDEIIDFCETNDVLIHFNLLFQNPIMRYGQYFTQIWDYGHYDAFGDENLNDPFGPYCYYRSDQKEPYMMFRDDGDMDLAYHKQRNRYYVSRYGWSPQIYTFELVSEPWHLSEEADNPIPLDGNQPDDWGDYTTYTAPFKVPSNLNHQNVKEALQNYNSEISSYIRNDLKHEDQLVAITVYADNPKTPWGSNAEFLDWSMSDNNIDIITFSLYTGAPFSYLEDDKYSNNNSVGFQENSYHHMINQVHQMVNKPVLFTEAGMDGYCDAIGGHIDNVMTLGFTGNAGFYIWAGYGHEPGKFDERVLWQYTIQSQNFMNDAKVTTALNAWSGNWIQGRQVGKIQNSDIKPPKELQYYISEGKNYCVGYIKNRTFNDLTTSDGCDKSYLFPLNELTGYAYNNGDKLNILDLHHKTDYNFDWFRYIDGQPIQLPGTISPTKKTKNNGMLKKIEHPSMLVNNSNSTQFLPIVWFFAQAEANGNRVVHLPDSIQIDLRTNNINYVFPNPAKDLITINRMEKESDVVYLYDHSGRLLIEQNIDENNNIDVSSLLAGVYYIKSKNRGWIERVIKI
jgi:hypothetical protein